jgi:hypothetical protein
VGGENGGSNGGTQGWAGCMHGSTGMGTERHDVDEACLASMNM